jgi:hypothetical protein
LRSAVSASGYNAAETAYGAPRAAYDEKFRKDVKKA